MTVTITLEMLKKARRNEEIKAPVCWGLSTTNGNFKTCDMLKREITSHKIHLAVAKKSGQVSHPEAIKKAKQIKVFEQALNEFETA